MDREVVLNLLEEALSENESLFLIDFTISNATDILITVDGDRGVSLKECMRISRHIEHNLDREEHDFSLLVTTPDITKPIVHPRQYIKNTGRILQVKTAGAKYEGRLQEVSLDTLVLTWKTREPKPVGKGKHTVSKQAEIAIKDIEEAIVKIEFN